MAAYRDFCAPAIKELEQQLDKMGRAPSKEQLGVLLDKLSFDMDSLISVGIDSECAAILAARHESENEPAEELEAASAQKPRKCRNRHSHAARVRHDAHHPIKWDDCPDNPDKNEPAKPTLRRAQNRARRHANSHLLSAH